MNLLICLTFLFCSLYSCSGQPCNDGVERPCLNDDLNCIGRVFARELQCDLIEGDIPDARTIHYLRLDYPSSNSSLIYHDAEVTGLSDFTVNNFYVNRRNNILVLEVVFNILDVEALNTDGYWYRKGKEVIVTNGYVYTYYKNYSLTLTVFNVDKQRRVNNQLNDYTVFTYVNDADPLTGDSRSFRPSETAAWGDYNSLYGNMSLTLQEETVNQGPLLMSYILPCDLKLSRFS